MGTRIIIMGRGMRTRIRGRALVYTFVIRRMGNL